ncbi:transporter [Rhizobium sp. WYCCWR 11128]|uniref:SphA family protein n=1 Tax=Rhizobium sp. WYCCWR 11128 TaxID=2749832 RepID=UPI0015D37C5A|nr:transporter [Rhizobium sp. WYCCWR 11128]NYT32749.1 transporter [Rhizobium sp. WYCCWR 11128]
MIWNVGRRLTMIAAVALLPNLAFAAERGAGFYLLGSKGPAAGILPPPGVFFQNDIWIYNGNLGGGKQLPTGGRIAVGVEGKAVLAAPTVLWVLREEVLGGRLGFGATVPFGWMETDADLTLAGPRGGTASGSITDTIFTIGDPVVSGTLGWDAGNFHWTTGFLVNVPIGDYQDGEISNLAFHHWGADISAAVTWLDPTIGLDLSAAVGMTFNAENPATDYRTGNEFHVEWAAVQHFNEQFDAGLVGYYYDQVSGDSGAGASSDFKGRVAAIGATIGWTFKAGEVPISTRIKYFHEFAAENRAEGDAVYLTISMPLSITKPMNIAAQ